MKTLMAMLCLVLLVGCSEQVTMEFRLADDNPGEQLTGMALAGGEETFSLEGDVLFSHDDVTQALVLGQGTHPFIELTFSEEASARFAQVTEENVGRRVGMIIDGELLSAPIIRAPITQGKAIIEGYFSWEEAERIAAGLCPTNPVAGS